ncbi:hypothetical protein [Streptomyces sp. NPDC048410]|uniref:hypothetical protein n=1 Tax=Streptomyces sp. NPDC048410 TaxID=3365545 RepID=UPI003712A83B
MCNHKKHLSAALASLLLAGGAVLGTGSAASAAPQAGHAPITRVESGDHRAGEDRDRRGGHLDGHRPARPTTTPRSHDGRNPCTELPHPGDRDFYRWDHGVSHLCESGHGAHHDRDRSEWSRQITIAPRSAADR